MPPRLFHGDAFGEVARLVGVKAFLLGEAQGEALRMNDVAGKTQRRRVVLYRYDFAAARADFLGVVRDFGTVRRLSVKHDYKGFVVYKRECAVF